MKVGDLVSINSLRRTIRPRPVGLHDGATRTLARGKPIDSWLEESHWIPVQGTGIVLKVSRDTIEARMVGSDKTYNVKRVGITVINNTGEENESK